MIRAMKKEDFITLDSILHHAGSDWSIATLKDCFNGYYFNRIICNKGSIVGFITIKNNHDCWEIMQMVVDINHRQQGFGRKLLKYTIKQAIKSQIQKIQLEVRASNSVAIKLYQRCGFYSVGIRKHYYKNGEDAVLMDYCCRTTSG